jgi:flagellar P-ring protein precursor FlgI
MLKIISKRQLFIRRQQKSVCCLLFALCCALCSSIASAQQTATPSKPQSAAPDAQNAASTQTAATPTPTPAKPQSDRQLTVRVKDIAEIEGVRGNQLIGYGIVVGLNRTGDRVQQNLYARQTLQNLLTRMGISTSADSLKPENMATVLVTATLPPFARQGTKIDILVSSIGDARSLQGGTLILSQLKGVDGQVYALAQGPISIGGIAAGDQGNSVEVNHPTVGRVPNGAMVERAVANNLGAQEKLTLALRQDDFTTASRLNRTVNERFGAGTARALDGRNVEVSIPDKWRDDRVSFIAELEALKLQTDMVAKVIINERTGTIIMGRDVRLASVAISQGGVTVRIGTEFEVSQPSVLSRTGETVTVPRTSVEVDERRPESIVLPDGATVDEVVRGLRAVGVSARDIISILQAIKAAGALAADLEMQ